MSKNEKLTKVKKRFLHTPFLKYVEYKNGKLNRFLRNYGANVDLISKFTASQPKLNEIHQDLSNKEKEFLDNTQQKKNNPKKKKLLSFLYFALNILVVAIVLIIQLSGEQDPSGSLSAILDVNWWFILAAVGTFFGVMIMDQIRFAVLIHKSEGLFRWNLSYKVAALGRYYDVITPLSTGGQPFQVIYLNKYGIKAGKSISMVLVRYIVSQIVLFTCASFFMFRNLIINNGGGFTGVASGIANTLGWIGYSVMAVVIFVVVFISFNKRVGASFIAGILKLLSKIHIGKFRIIKDYKKTFIKVMRTVNAYQKAMKQYLKSPGTLIACFLCSIIFFLLYYSMPFFIYCGFEGWHPEAWIQLVTIAIIVDLSSAFNPIPMGTGTADLSFTALFASFFSTKGAQVWALIIWRIIFYYIYIAQGMVIISYDYAIGNRRLEKNKQLWMMPLRERLKYKIKNKSQKN